MHMFLTSNHYPCYYNYYDCVIVHVYILFPQGLVLTFALEWEVEQFQIVIYMLLQYKVPAHQPRMVD